MNTTLPTASENVETAPFDETVYRAWNQDVDAAVRAGSLESGWQHFEAFGRDEQRLPFWAPKGCCGAPPFAAGDELVQSLKPVQNHWAGMRFSVGTHGDVARLVFDCSVLRAETGEVVRTFRFDDWAGDGEKLAFKFPPIEDSSAGAFLFRIVVSSVEAPHGAQLHCEPASEGDGLIWNGAAPAAVRAEMELLYTPTLLPGPSGITLNPMTQCAGECIHCLGRSHQRKPGSLKKEWIEALRVHFRDGPGGAWCLDYATEFFNVARWRPELIDLLVAKGSIAINTEGHHITADALRRMFEGNVIRIGFSCDAATEETYAIVRKGLGKLQTVLDAAKMAVQVRRETPRAAQTRLALSMVVMQTNIHELPALVDLAAQTGVDAVWANQLWVCTDDMVKESLAFAPELWREHWEAALRRGRELGIEVRTGADLRPEHPQQGIIWCPEPWSAMVVLGNGDVLACASPASRIGSLADSSIDEIWNGEAFQELRRRVNSDRPPLMCEHCFVYRKPGNFDGVFTHHLLDDYDLRRDLLEPGYGDAFRERFSFARARASEPAP